MSSDIQYTWAICELLGHLTLAGRLLKPGELGGVWQIDIPIKDSFHTEFFGDKAIYRIRIVPEVLARKYAQELRDEITDETMLLMTHDEHERITRRLRETIEELTVEVEELRRKSNRINYVEAGNEL